MNSIKNLKDAPILVVVDPSAKLKQVCVQRAALLAKTWNVPLELLVCHYDQHLSGERFFDSPGLAKSRKDAIHNRSTFLEKIARPLRESGLTVKTTALWDTPLDESIVRYVQLTKPGLVVKDTHYHKALSRAFFSNTDWDLIRTCPVPLWLCKTDAWTESRSVLAAVDPMHTHDKPAELDGQILQFGQLLSQSFDADLHVFHSYPIMTQRLSVNPELYAESLANLDEEIATEHKKALTELLDKNNCSDVQTHVVSGEASQQLPAAVEQTHASIVVMGAVARKPLARIFLGSTAEKVMDKVCCDLLIIKPSWFESDLAPSDPEFIETVNAS